MYRGAVQIWPEHPSTVCTSPQQLHVYYYMMTGEICYYDGDGPTDARATYTEGNTARVVVGTGPTINIIYYYNAIL